MKLLGKKPTIDHDPKEFTRPPHMSAVRRIVMGLCGVGLGIFGVYLTAAGASGGKGLLMACGLFSLVWAGVFLFTSAFPKADI